MMFSVIIPVYNVAPYLGECLDSLLRQSFADWEAICVDDGSTDDSGNVLEQFAEKDARFKVIHQRNGGVSKARNKALAIARGDWLLFLDGDDVLSASCLQDVLAAIKAEPCVDVVTFGLSQFKDGEKVDFRTGGGCEVANVSDALDMRSMGGWFVQRAYRRSVIDGLRFPDLAHGEDMVFMVQTLLRANIVLYVNQELYGYRQRAGSASHVQATASAVTCALTYLSMIFMAVEESSKVVASRMVRRWCNLLTEKVVYDVQHLPKEVRAKIFASAQMIWKRVFGLRCVPMSRRFRYLMFRLFPTFAMARLLFAFPHFLKMKGLHR